MIHYPALMCSCGQRVRVGAEGERLADDDDLFREKRDVTCPRCGQVIQAWIVVLAPVPDLPPAGLP